MSEQELIRKMAHDFWNWDKIPPEEYWEAVRIYFRDHPEEFKGAGPQ